MVIKYNEAVIKEILDYGLNRMYQVTVLHTCLIQMTLIGVVNNTDNITRHEFITKELNNMEYKLEHNKDLPNSNSFQQGMVF